MKTNAGITKLVTAILVAAFTIALNAETIAQDKSATDLKPFKITIEKTGKGVALRSNGGSAWIDLSFQLADGKLQLIDEYGMTKLGRVLTDKDPKLADFLIAITSTKDGFTLTGIEGTAWKELSFTLGKHGKQAIDQFGMTE